MATNNYSFQTGVAQANITPPVGINLVGFAGRGPSIGIHDELRAKVIVMTDGTSKAALVDCDLVGLGAEVVKDIRDEISERVAISTENITILCTHTHYGPDAYRDKSADDVMTYQANLKYKIAGAVFEAWENMRPAEIGVGWGKSYIGINRREKRPDGSIILGQNPEGPIDRQVGVLRVNDADGNPIASLTNFATHPVSQSSKMRMVSADYPGKACEIVTQLTDCPCLFLQGACGNINSALMENSYEPPRTLGTRLGCEIVRVWETIETKPVSSLGIASQTVSLPRIKYGSEENAEKLVKSIKKQLESLRAAEKPNKGSIYWAETRLKKAKEALQSWRTGEPLPEISAELQVLYLDDFAYATAPAEVFNQIGSEIKERSPFSDTFFLGYANGSIGYIPVPEAYPEGGYEVTHASQVNPEAAGIITHGCLELLGRLKRKQVSRCEKEGRCAGV